MNDQLNCTSLTVNNQNTSINSNNNNNNNNNNIEPLTIDVDNLTSSNQTTSSTSLPTNKKRSNTLHQMQHSLSNHETDVHYMDYQNQSASVNDKSICGNQITQQQQQQQQRQQYPYHHHPSHNHHQQHKVVDENLRKTVSEPSLKMRSGSGGVQKPRNKPDRRHYGMNTAAVAVAAAAAAMTVSNDPLAIVGLWPQLSSAFQHANLIQKSINYKKPLQQLHDMNSSNMSSVDSDDKLTKSDIKSIPQSLMPSSTTYHDNILTELIKTNQSISNQDWLETINTYYSNSSKLINSLNYLNDSTIYHQCILNGVCSSLPNLTGRFHRTSQRNNTHSNISSITNTTLSTDTSEITTTITTATTTTTTASTTSTTTTGNVTGSSYESNELNQLDTTMSDNMTDINDVTNMELVHNNTQVNFNQKPLHFFPYYRQQSSIGLISRTRSAPLSLSTGYSTNRHLHNLSNSMNASTSVTSAANILAMEAAASNFGSQQQQQNNSSTINQSITEHDISTIKSDNSLSTTDCELSSRSKVVLQLRKKILERSEFLTSDRSGIDANTSFSRTTDQITERGNPLLERTASSPVVNMAPTLRAETVPETTFTTVLAYDLGMLTHHCTCQTDANHPENPQRLISIWQRLQQTGLAAQCHHQPGRRASLIELQLVHRDVYTVLFGSNPASRCRIDPTLLATVRLCRLACGGVGVDSDTAWHTAGHTAHAARLAAGCVVDLACRVMLGQCPNGFALVRPPGHHAEPGQAMGFCYFNSVAIAAKRVQFLGSTTLSNEQSSIISPLANTLFDQSTFLPYTMEPTHKPRILILDWDIHHGNGTQTVFYTDPTVLYISLHRHDEGGFFPGTGSPEEIGAGPGEGYTINIAWPSGIIMSDAEYLAAFRLIVLPVACEFQPSLVLVSAGFDAAPGHSANLGGYSVSPAAFGWMTRLLSIDRIANSKVVLSLEGGYDLNSLCDCTEACVRALLQSAAEMNEKNATPMNVPNLMPIKQSELDRIPHPAAIQTLLKVAHLHSIYWNSFSKQIDTEYASLPASKWLPTLFNANNIHSSNAYLTTVNDVKSKSTVLPHDNNVMTSGTIVENNNRYFNFTMRQASSMDETIETEIINLNARRRRSTTGITLSNMDSMPMNDTNETITRIALTRLAELHVTQQPD
ncbi:Histone deacetylase 4 [Schistosoma japonicum]|uniref:histone deacetylase n=1 Tax=Schistosoma japonicum TaxID=6182 RepID=A0A4Z2DJU2_SCHJA|nr:Histone deacetylase 4 [Schistosoma japonicum]